MTIADRISELRKARELSQEELAELTGVSRQAVSKWESEQSVPDMYNVVTLSEVFGVTTDYLLKGVEDVGDRPERKNKPEKVYNIIATTLNVLGLVISFGIGAIYGEYLAATIIGFIFAVLGIMTFMLGTTRLTRREQFPNACRFFRINVWLLAFFVFSVIYNALLGSGIAPFPLMPTVVHVDGKMFVNGREAGQTALRFASEIAPMMFAVIYMLVSAGTTYVLTLAERKQWKPFSKNEESAE